MRLEECHGPLAAVAAHLTCGREGEVFHGHLDLTNGEHALKVVLDISCRRVYIDGHRSLTAVVHVEEPIEVCGRGVDRDALHSAFLGHRDTAQRLLVDADSARRECQARTAHLLLDANGNTTARQTVVAHGKVRDVTHVVQECHSPLNAVHAIRSAHLRDDAYVANVGEALQCSLNTTRARIVGDRASGLATIGEVEVAR